MWVCPNCETANNSQRYKCAVCESEKPFSYENPNSPSILRSKIQELEEQILILNEERISLNQSKETLSSELSRVKYALNTSNKENSRLKKELEKITSEKTNVDNKLKQIEKDKASLSSSLTTTKAELETKVTNLQAEVEKLKQDDNTGCLGIIIVILFIGLIVSVVTCSTKSSTADTSKVSELESQVKNLQSKTEQLQSEKQKIENKLRTISRKVPFVITSIDFENSAERNNYKRNFNYNRVRYISPRLKIIPIANSWSGKISVKYFEPNGTLNRNPTVSPSGFTFTDETNIHSAQEYIYLSGWGSGSGSTYEVGTHTAEIWYNGKIIGKQTFTISY
jgi:uncharacterized protein YlxW (UPF0749 family)